MTIFLLQKFNIGQNLLELQDIYGIGPELGLVVTPSFITNVLRREFVKHNSTSKQDSIKKTPRTVMLKNI